jgi:hypothetical protein
MIIPAGMLSVKVIPLSGVPFGFTNRMLIVDAEPPKTVSGLKPLTTPIERLARPETVKFDARALEGTRFSLFVIFAGGMVLVYVPGIAPVTKTLIRQRVPARMVPLVREMEVAPVMAVNTAPAPQPLVEAGVELLIVTLGGRLSTIEKFVRFVSPGAKMSILKRELPPGVIVEGENVFIPVSSDPAIETLAFAGRRFVAPWLVVIALAGIVFVNVPLADPAGAVT